MEYVYPAIFHANEDNSYTITYPDLPGCISEGKSLGNALYMAQSALTQWIEYLSEGEQTIPKASNIKEIKTDSMEFVNLIRADIKSISTAKRAAGSPKWLTDNAAERCL